MIIAVNTGKTALFIQIIPMQDSLSRVSSSPYAPVYSFFYLFALAEMSVTNKQTCFPLISGPQSQRLFRGLTKCGGLDYSFLEPEKNKSEFLSSQKRTGVKSIVRITRLHAG